MVYCLPQFSVENIKKYANMVTAGVLSKPTIVKKHFSREKQLREERYVNIGFPDFYCFKGVCGASPRKQNRIIFCH